MRRRGRRTACRPTSAICAASWVRGRLVTEGRAYRLDLEGVTVDSMEFEREVAAARVALEEPRPSEAVGLLRSALARWRGPVLIDVVDHSWGQAEIARLTELHGAAHELLLQALLATGQYGEVVVAGEQAVTEHPLREELWRSLMLGLARAGRTAEAGRVFRRYRTWLGEELGLGAERRAVRAGRGDHLRRRSSSVGAGGRAGAGSVAATGFDDGGPRRRAAPAG